MPWTVLNSEEVESWVFDLTQAQQAHIVAAVEVLADRGPVLGRPLVDLIKGSRFKNMKELRISEGGDIRILFIFDPLRQAILLLGGNKDGQWNSWYAENIPNAEGIYSKHLERLREEGEIE